jgi:four helix bundle protein
MLTIGHRQWEPYQQAQMLAKEIYRVTTLLPDTERAVLVYTLRRLTITLCQNLATAALKRGKKRKRLLQACLDDCIAMDTQLELAVVVQALPEAAAAEAFKQLHGLYKKIGAIQQSE